MWFRAIFEFVSRKHGCNAMRNARLLGLRCQANWEWLHMIREVFVRKGRNPLKGDVEADEPYVGESEEGVRSRALGEKKTLVFGAVELVDRHCGRSRLPPVEAASAEHLQTALSDMIEEGANVRTDIWSGYTGLQNAYRHRLTTINWVSKQPSRAFPHIHRDFFLFKRVLIGAYHGSWSERYAALYYEKLTLRFNRTASTTRTLVFRRMIEQTTWRAPRLRMVAWKCHLRSVLPGRS